jgi:dolichol-phosphate mannosyltransferase
MSLDLDLDPDATWDDSGREGKPRLSVVVPVRDEAGALPGLIAELDKTLAQCVGGVEFIFVDDGSTDRSLAILSEHAARDDRLQVISLGEQRGQSAALDAGFRIVRGEFTVTLDADGQNDPADILRMLSLLDRADVVNGIRVRRHDDLGRRLASRIANALRNWMTHESVTDIGCSLRVIRSRYLRHIKLERGLHRFLPTLLRMEGARLAEIPVRHRARQSGRSKYGLVDRLPQAVSDLMLIRRMQAHRARATAIAHRAARGASANEREARRR